MGNFVRDERKKALGKEHPYRLPKVLAMQVGNLSRVKSLMGQHHEAARINKRRSYRLQKIRASWTLEDHVAVSAGKTHYAEISVQL